MSAPWRFLSAGLALASACAAPPEAPPPPPALLASDHFAGSIHTGPLAVQAGAHPSPPRWYELRFAYAEQAPDVEGKPLSACARQVFVAGGGDPIRSRSPLALGIVCIEAPGTLPATSAELVRVEPAWPETTTCWRAEIDRTVYDPPRTSWSSIEIELSPPSDLAIVLESRDALSEHLVLDPRPSDGAPALRLFLPAPRVRAPAGGFVLELRAVEPPPAGRAAVAEESARGAIAASVARARTGSAPVSNADGFRFEISSALRSLADEDLLRPALAFLAQASGAEAAGDLVIGAEPAALASYAAASNARLKGSDLDPRSPESLGWILESETYRWLAARAADGLRPIEPAFEALLLVHTGALGRFPDLVEEAVDGSGSLADFRARLVEGNRIFLEDADPSARLRAFEWLQGRGEAPEGFDPLAPLAERRAALERAREQGAGEALEDGGRDG